MALILYFTLNVFSDGKQTWSVIFAGEIDKTNSRVQWKKRKLHLLMKKKIHERWTSLEVNFIFLYLSNFFGEGNTI